MICRGVLINELFVWEIEAGLIVSLLATIRARNLIAVKRRKKTKSSSEGFRCFHFRKKNFQNFPTTANFFFADKSNHHAHSWSWQMFFFSTRNTNWKSKLLFHSKMSKAAFWVAARVCPTRPDGMVTKTFSCLSIEMLTNRLNVCCSPKGSTGVGCRSSVKSLGFNVRFAWQWWWQTNETTVDGEFAFEIRFGVWWGRFDRRHFQILHKIDAEVVIEWSELLSLCIQRQLDDVKGWLAWHRCASNSRNVLGDQSHQEFPIQLWRFFSRDLRRRSHRFAQQVKGPAN